MGVKLLCALIICSLCACASKERVSVATTSTSTSSGGATWSEGRASGSAVIMYTFDASKRVGASMTTFPYLAHWTIERNDDESDAAEAMEKGIERENAQWKCDATSPFDDVYWECDIEEQNPKIIITEPGHPTREYTFRPGDGPYPVAGGLTIRRH